MTADDYADPAPPAGETKPKPAGGRSGQPVKVQGKPAAPVLPKRVQKIIAHIEAIKAPFVPAFDPEKAAEKLGLYWLNYGSGSRYLEMPIRLDGSVDAEGEVADLHKDSDVSLRIQEAFEDLKDRDRRRLMLHIQRKRVVRWAGSLAGYRVGIHEINGQRVAVKNTFRLIEPRKGDWPVIEKWIQTAFDDYDVPQIHYQLAWLKSGYLNLREGWKRPGYINFLIGPSNVGKSIWTNLLVKPLFGGRTANPLPHLLSKDNFNDDLCGNELLAAGELKGCKTNHEARAELAEGLKDLAVNEEHRLRAQYSAAINVPICRRILISLNDEPEKFKAAPALTADFRDKVIMAKMQKADLTFDTSTHQGWADLAAAVRRELPAFLAWLIDEWKMPTELAVGPHVGRFGHAAYIHPDLEALLFGQTAESAIMHAIDNSGNVFTEKYDDGNLKPWFGHSYDLRDLLLAGSCADLVKGLLSYPGACGTALGKLAHQFPERMKPVRLTNTGQKNQHRWEIQPPPQAN